MITKLEITAIHGKLTPAIKQYVQAKIGEVDKFVSRIARASMHVEVKLKEQKTKDKVKYICEPIVFLPHGQVMVQARGETVEAAIDEAEAKLKVQLKKYKEKHAGAHMRHRIIRLFNRH